MWMLRRCATSAHVFQTLELIRSGKLWGLISRVERQLTTSLSAMCCLIVIFGGGGFVCGIRKDAVLGNQWTMKIVEEISRMWHRMPIFWRFLDK